MPTGGRYVAMPTMARSDARPRVCEHVYIMTQRAREGGATKSIFIARAQNIFKRPVLAARHQLEFPLNR
jgi:hypothetical protein